MEKFRSLSAPAVRVQKRTLATRQKIFETSIRLFQERGFEDTTVEAITNCACVAKGTFFAHFSTKEAVIDGLGDAIFDFVSEKNNLDDHSEPIEALRNAFSKISDWNQKNSDLSLLLCRTGRFHNDRLTTFFLGLLRNAQAQGLIDNCLDLIVGTDALYGAYSYSLLRWHQSGRTYDLKKRVLSVVDILLAGIIK